MTVSHLLDFDGLADSGLIQLLLKHLVPEGILLLVEKKHLTIFFESAECLPKIIMIFHLLQRKITMHWIIGLERLLNFSVNCGCIS